MLSLIMQGIGIDIGSIVVLLLLFRSDWQVAPLELPCCALEATSPQRSDGTSAESIQCGCCRDRHGRSRSQG